MEQFLNDLVNFCKTDGITIAKVIAIVIFGLIAVRIIMSVIRRYLLKGRRDKTVIKFVLSIINVALYIALIFIAGVSAGISTTSFIAALSAVALAVSLALKDSLSNLANGLIVIGTKPFIEGDWVQVNGVEGSIREIGLFNTKLLTADNRVIAVPNNMVTGSNVINYSKSPSRRVDIEVPVAYGSDIEIVKKVLIGLAESEPQILPSPNPVCKLLRYDDSSMVFSLRTWVPNSSYWDVYFSINEKIPAIFKANDIKIPFNTMDINIKTPISVNTEEQ